MKQLRNVSKIRTILSFQDTEKIIHAFVSSRLDYCNSLYTCLSRQAMARLQVVQNSAARLLTRTHRRTHITPILASLHWLPIAFRVDFKILLITYKALHGLAPAYITELLSPYQTNRPLRSSDKALLAVPESRLKMKGDRAFSITAPRLWNSLPLELRTAESVSSFKTKLKTHLYRLAYN